MPSVIPRRLILLERAIVLFVNNHQAQLRSRRKNGTASPDNHVNVPRRDLLPIPMSLRVRQLTMQHGDSRKPAAETLPRLWGQADFRDQHNRLFTAGDDLFYRLQINLGLPTTRYTMQQNRARLGSFDCLKYRTQTLGLLGTQDK